MNIGEDHYASIIKDAEIQRAKIARLTEECERLVNQRDVVAVALAAKTAEAQRIFDVLTAKEAALAASERREAALREVLQRIELMASVTYASSVTGRATLDACADEARAALAAARALGAEGGGDHG